eukprot:264445_1
MASPLTIRTTPCGEITIIQKDTNPITIMLPSLGCVNCHKLYEIIAMLQSNIKQPFKLQRFIHTNNEIIWHFSRLYKANYSFYNAKHPYYKLLNNNHTFGDCKCPNCCLQFYLQTNYIFMEQRVKHYYALMDLHGPQHHYLILRKCSKVKRLFIIIFGYYCRRILETNALDTVCEQFATFLECCKWFTFRHIEWILHSKLTRKYIVQLYVSYFREQQTGMQFIFDAMFIRINEYSVKYKMSYYKCSLKHTKEMKLINKYRIRYMGMIDYSKTDHWFYCLYYANGWEKLKKCGNVKCKNNTQPRKLFICKGCKLIYYCSKKCQKYAWNRLDHQIHCYMSRGILRYQFEEVITETCN